MSCSIEWSVWFLIAINPNNRFEIPASAVKFAALLINKCLIPAYTAVTKTMEIQYDPSTGSANIVQRGSNNQPVDPELPTLEEINQRQLNTAAKGLGQRAAKAHQASAGDTEKFDAETKLLEVQAAINREENALKRESLIAEAEKLAASLVGGTPEPLKAPGEPSREEAKDQWFQEYRNTNPDIDEALEYAGSVMGEELAPAFNELIESDDEEVRVGALRTVQHLRKDPNSFISAEDSTGISETTEAEIAQEYGTELAHAVSVLGNGVASGAISSQQAIATASKDPRLLNVLYQLASSGRIRIAL